MSKISPPYTRRAFFADAPRLVLLGALAALTGKLAGRTTPPDRARHRCTGDSLCSHCPGLSQCVLPLAESFKNHNRRRPTPERTT